MNKELLKNMEITIKKHSPEILTGIGIVGFFGTAIKAVDSTPKALRLISEAEEDKKDKLTRFEIVKTTWKCYIPSLIMGLVSTGCIVGASSFNIRRNAALATAYTLSETALKEYKDKVRETIGEKKERVVRDNIAKDKIEKNPASNKEVIITNKGDNLCFDSMSGRYFKSDIDAIEKVVNQLNKTMMSDMYISLNDFYYEIGLDPILLGNELGWHIDKGLIEVSFSSQISDDGNPCIVIEYNLTPQYRGY